MSENHVIKVNKETVQAMKNAYQSFMVKKQIPYTEFVAKKAGTTITAYTSGKVMFQGNQAEKEAGIWKNNERKSATKYSTAKIVNNSQLPINLADLSVVGSDEVGNGSYFGPVTVCAAYVDKTMITTLKSLGVRDSKEMKDQEMKTLAGTIKQIIPYQLLIVQPKKYNQIQPNYNAVHMKVALHNQAINLLLQKIAPKIPECIVIDQFTPESNYKKYLKTEKNPITKSLVFVTKGEQYHVAVAAASIISRAAFLEELEKESQELGLIVPSGAGSKSDKLAAKILQQGGIELLENYAKLHFANTKKAMKLAEK